MRAFFAKSFRNRMFASFLIVSIIPVIICSALLLQIFRIRLTSNAEKQADQDLNSVVQTIDFLYGGFERIADIIGNSAPLKARLLSGSTDDIQVYNELFSATEDMRNYAYYDIYDAIGDLRYTTRQTPQNEKLPVGRGVLNTAVRSGEPLEFIAADDITDRQRPLLQGAVALINDNEQTAGYLLISIYQSQFNQLLEGRHSSQYNLIILSRYWRPVYCVQPSLATELAPILRQQFLAGRSLNAESDEFLYNVGYHQSSGLYAVLQRPNIFNQDTMYLLYTIGLTSILVCVAISVLMSLQISRQMFRPISKLRRAIGQVEQNNLNVHVSYRHKDELGQLAERFNDMLAALKRNQEQLVENQRKLNQAQIRMLQAQLNPHFLCNTLDTMKWISKINKVPEVALMSTNLADILRFCISPVEFVPLSKEIEIAERYVEIQNIRLSGALTLLIDVPIELENCLVPKMVLQPIVENAILHGLEGIKQGVIKVSAIETSDDFLRIAVSDNGRGLPPYLTGSYADKAAALPSGHLGLYNVDTILSKYYGKGFGLFLDNDADSRGAVVTAVLPVRREEEI